MPSFETKTIEDLTDILIDYRGKTPEKTPAGVKLITAKVIKGGFIQEGNHEFIADENYDSWMRRGLPRQWDILITTEAPLGEVAQLRTSEKVALAQRVILLRGKSSLIDQGYYFQALKSDFVQAELKSRATGTTVLGIKQSELKKVRIPYYPLPIQRKIAAILSAYDDLIENNTRRIRILEEMAQAIYREWFVHFRFPGHEGVRMVESKLGLIPEGWEVTSLSKIFSDVKGIVMTGPFGSNLHASDYKEEGVPLILVKHVKNGKIIDSDLPLIGEPKLSELARYRLKYGDIVVTRVGFVGESAFIHEPYKGWLFSGQMLRVRIPKNQKIQPRFLAQFYQSYVFKKSIENFAVGTTRLSLNTDILSEMLIFLPPISIQNAFTQFVENIDNLIIILNKKNINLRRTRDLLLPRLISGELDVSELDIVIPEEDV